MTVSAPNSISSIVELVKLAALPLPEGASAAARPPDRVDFGQTVQQHNLFDLASAGLRQLSALLPTLDRMVRPANAAPLPLPVGHLARALGDAAHWIDAGWTGALAAETSPSDATPDALAAWRRAAHHALNETELLLAQAGRHFEPAAPVPHAVSPQPTDPELLWAIGQIVGAQRQVAAARLNLAQAAALAPTVAASGRRRISGDHMVAIGLLGMLLNLLFYGIVVETWAIVAGSVGFAIALGSALAWGWRIGRPTLRLDLRR